jgi:hypothetical protein
MSVKTLARVCTLVPITLALAHCVRQDPTPSAPKASPRATTETSSQTSLATPPGTQRAEGRPWVFGGANTVRNAAWIGDQAVAVTGREVWRIDPEKPSLLRRTPLSRSVGVAGALLAVARPAGRTAVTLHDGSIDIFEGDGKLARTLPAGNPVIELHFTPNGTELAVTRSHDKKGEWFERTTVVDVASGTDRFSFEGGGPIFDPESKQVATRAGVFDLATGTKTTPWRNGFQVLLDAGIYGDMKTSHGEVVAGDYVARGFFQGMPFYMNTTAQDASLFDQPNHETKIAAACVGGRKISTVADAERGRLIGVCTNGVVITDLGKRTSTRITFPVAKTMPMFSLDVLRSSTSSTFAIDMRDYPMTVVDPDSSSFHAASAGEWKAFRANSGHKSCAGPAGGNVYVACENPALRADGEYLLHVNDGLSIVSRRGEAVVDWGLTPRAAREAERSIAQITADQGMRLEWRGGRLAVRTARVDTLRYAFSGPGPSAEAFAPTAECGDKPFLQVSEDEFAFYSAYEGKTQVTAHVACHCTAQGCKRTAVLPPFSILTASQRGAIAVVDLNSTHTQTKIEVRASGSKTLRTSLPTGCIHGAFGSNANLFVACSQDWRYEIVELSSSDLSVVHRKAAPPLGHVSALVRTDEGFAVMMGASRNGMFGSSLTTEWFSSPAAQPNRELYMTETFGMLQAGDDKLEIAGDSRAAAFGLRCLAGDTLMPWDACQNR